MLNVPSKGLICSDLLQTAMYLGLSASTSTWFAWSELHINWHCMCITSEVLRVWTDVRTSQPHIVQLEIQIFITVLWKIIPPNAHTWQWLSKSMRIGLWIHFGFIQWNLLQQSGTFSSLSLERPSLFTFGTPWWLQRSPINSWRPNAKIWRRAGTPRCHLRPHEKLQRSLGTPWSLKRPHGKFLRWSGRP